MTIVTLNAPLNLITTTLWEGDLVGFPTATEIKVSDGAREGTFTGDFTFNFLTAEVFGTLNSFVTTIGGAAEYSFTGMDVDANTLFNAVDADDIDLAFSLVLGGNDTFNGSSGRDILFADSGNDEMFGNVGNDILKGQGGGDKLLGGNGRDKLLGGVGNDNLQGGLGNDKLFGGGGRDKIVGGKGADKLTGGAGIDKFVFNDTSGNDVINDFQIGTDILNFKTSAEVSAEATHEGASTLLTWGANSVVLLDITLEEYVLI